MWQETILLPRYIFLFFGVFCVVLKRENGIDPVLVISRKPIDKVIAARYDQFEYFVTRALPFSKKPGKFLLFIWSQLVSACSCIKFLWKKDIDCVIGTGGFTILVLVASAFLMRKKSVGAGLPFPRSDALSFLGYEMLSSSAPQIRLRSVLMSASAWKRIGFP